MADYSEITDPDLQSRLRERYQCETSALRALGFRPLAYALEVLSPYSAITQFPVLLLAFNKKEVLTFRRPLRLAVANILEFHTDPPAIALCMGMGVKLYTGFTDNFIVITSDFQTYAVPKPFSQITRLSPFPTIEETWRVHREHALARSAQGIAISESHSFRDYVDMSNREESLLQ